MRHHLFLSYLALAKVVAAGVCNARCSPRDTCISALSARQNSASSDCSAYLGLTVTQTTADTEGTTTTTAFASVSIVDKRSEDIPEYAMACSDAARYVSACSCLGVDTAAAAAAATTTATTSQAVSTTSQPQTVQTSTTTATQSTGTVTQTSSVTIPSATQTPFGVIAHYSSAQASNTNIYAYTYSRFLGSSIDFTSDPTAAMSIVINPDGSLTSTQGQTSQWFLYIAPGNQQYSPVIVTTSEIAVQAKYTKLNCHADAGSNLVCSINGKLGAWWICGTSLDIAEQGYDHTNDCYGGVKGYQIGLTVSLQS